MTIPFQKYQATGNDFVVVDNLNGQFSFSSDDVIRICDRKFGVGADGVMLLKAHDSLDFDLIYFNADGSPSLCGNGCRAAVKMASSLKIINGKAKFMAYDGSHEAELLGNGNVRLKMNDVPRIETSSHGVFINTGSPHFIQFVTDIENFDVFSEGRKIRYAESFKPQGTNANFVEQLGDNSIFVRTYERGVENETLSCGTGVTAAALAVSMSGYTSPVSVKTLGGELSVEFKLRHDGSFTDIFLVGPAKMVFAGTLEL